MKKAIPKKHGGKRKGAGRKPKGRDPTRAFRLPDELIAAVDAWAKDHNATRSEAVRALLTEALRMERLLDPRHLGELR
jgi:hypothetical protein